MKTPKANSKTSWNSNRAVGPKTEFTRPQTRTTELYLLRDRNWHDLALMSFGLDSMLRASDLLSITVADVAYPSQQIRSEVRTRQQKTDRNVYPVLTEATKTYLAHWIQVSGKQPEHFLFTRGKAVDAAPISRGHYASLVKSWADWLGLPVEEYSTHSLRRSKPVWMYEHGETIGVISKLLGHKSTEVTLRYLGIDQKKAAAAALRHPMMKGPSSAQLQEICKNGLD